LLATSERIRSCELLPRTARHTDKLPSSVRCIPMTYNHDVSGYWNPHRLSYGPGSARQIKPNDWPLFRLHYQMLKPERTPAALTSVWVPDVMRLTTTSRRPGKPRILGVPGSRERFVGRSGFTDLSHEGLDPTADLTPARLNRPPRFALPDRYAFPHPSSAAAPSKRGTAVASCV